MPPSQAMDWTYSLQSAVSLDSWLKSHDYDVVSQSHKNHCLVSSKDYDDKFDITTRPTFSKLLRKILGKYLAEH